MPGKPMAVIQHQRVRLQIPTDALSMVFTMRIDLVCSFHLNRRNTMKIKLTNVALIAIQYCLNSFYPPAAVLCNDNRCWKHNNEFIFS